MIQTRSLAFVEHLLRAERGSMVVAIDADGLFRVEIRLGRTGERRHGNAQTLERAVSAACMAISLSKAIFAKPAEVDQRRKLLHRVRPGPRAVLYLEQKVKHTAGDIEC